MLDQIKALAREENMCVLATDAGGRPYCSLMAYVTDEACTEVYMVTHRKTQKFQNLTKNPAVSLLIDSRKSAARAHVRALTVEGSFRKIDDLREINRIKAMLLDAHPHLGEFIEHADPEVLRIKISAFLLFNGLNDSHYHEI